MLYLQFVMCSICSVTKCVSSRSMLLATAPTTMGDGEQDSILLVEPEIAQQVSSFALDIGKNGCQIICKSNA